MPDPDLPTITIHEAQIATIAPHAVGITDHPAEDRHRPGHGEPRCEPDEDAARTITLATLDDALDEREPVALIEIDATGMEPTMLRGAVANPHTRHPVIAVEQNQPAVAAGAAETASMAVLRSEGYAMEAFLEGRHGRECTRFERP